METNSSPARRMPEARAALKEQQKARLAAKQKLADGEITSEEYSAMYASQPTEVAKRKAQEAESMRRQVAKNAMVNAAIGDANANAEAFRGGES